jgi:glycosyltransferase 2 family protein
MPVVTSPASRTHVLAVVVALTLIAYACVTLWAGWNEVANAVKRVGIVGIFAGLLMTLLNTLLRSARWQQYLGVLNARVPPLRSVGVYVAGFALATTPGGAGEPLVRSILLKRYGVSYDRTVAAYLSERVSDIMAMLLIASIGLSSYPAGTPFLIIVACAIAAFLIVVSRREGLSKVSTFLQSRAGPVSRFVRYAVGTLRHAGECFSPRSFLFGLLLGAMAWTINAASFYLMAQLAGAQLDFSAAMFIYAFAVLVGGLSFLPGGLGGAEAAMIALLIFHGIPEGQAVAITLVHRTATLWFSVLIGGVCFYRQGRSLPKDVNTTTAT